MPAIEEYLIGQSANPTGAVGRLMLRIMNRAYLPMARWALGLLPGLECKPAKILDVGMGNGASSALLAGRFGGVEIVGVDISQSAIEAACKRYPAGRFPSLRFGKADVCGGLPFGNGEFGLACAFQTHFHWGDIPAGFAELRRVLAASGVLLVAFETVKLDYFAPEQREEAAVKALAQAAGFGGAAVYTHGGWTAWLLRG